jgi:predicted dehydrogenase
LFAKNRVIDETKILGCITHAYGQWNRSIDTTLPRGAPKGYPIEDATLKKYGYDTMDRFRNWRWYKKYGSGPIADLGSHQIDIFGWFLNARPMNLTARGGLDYYKDKGYECYDNVLAIYEFTTSWGLVRAFYQVLSTTSARGYFETFMGTEGTLQISERASLCRVYAEGYLTPGEGEEHPWDKWAAKGYLIREPKTAEEKPKPKTDADAILAMYVPSRPPVTYLFKIEVEEMLHKAHLENFFAAVRGEAKLNCPGEVGYETCVQVLRANDAVPAGKTLEFKEADFKV